MQIRREDEEFINCLKLLGSGLGAILTVFVVFCIHSNANKQLAEHRRYIENNTPILALANLQVTSENIGQGKKKLVRGILDNAGQAQSELIEIEEGFWAGLPLGALAGVCAVAGVAGLIGGYWSVWLLSWISALVTIKLIRSAYEVIWRLNPEFDGGKSQARDNDNNVYIKRDKDRVLPGILTISLMGLIGLILFSVAVYYLAGQF
ncbi:MAG: hypothetical protein ACYTFK_10180 [Planctomycetota bacterium]|jgi:hypothetical protein